MTEITPDFNICLREYGAQPTLRKEYNLDQIDAFLQDAYSIVRSANPLHMRYTHSLNRMLDWCLLRKSYEPYDRATSPQPHPIDGDKPTETTERDL